MTKKRNVNNKKDNSNIINIAIIVGIVFLIGSLVLMFVKSDKTDNNIQKISYSEYLDVIKKDKYSIILLTNPTCSHCNNYKPYVNYIASEYNLDVYDIDLTTITYDEYVELHDKYTAIKDEYDEGNPMIPTPATIIVRDNKEITSTLGDIGYNGLSNLLKKHQIIK